MDRQLFDDVLNVYEPIYILIQHSKPNRSKLQSAKGHYGI